MKVFQIGFNRCGTSSIYEFFRQNGFNSIHGARGYWETQFQKNLSEGKPLCNDEEDIIFWGDIQFIQRHFQIFAEQYPTSKFIYNIRNVDDWVLSRKKWFSENPPAVPYIRDKVAENIKDEDYWKAEWAIQKKIIEEFFVGIYSNRLLTFDIDKHTGEDIKNLLPELNFTNLTLPHTNKTKTKFII